MNHIDFEGEVEVPDDKSLINLKFFSLSSFEVKQVQTEPKKKKINNDSI